MHFLTLPCPLPISLLLTLLISLILFLSPSPFTLAAPITNPKYYLLTPYNHIPVLINTGYYDWRGQAQREKFMFVSYVVEVQ